MKTSKLFSLLITSVLASTVMMAGSAFADSRDEDICGFEAPDNPEYSTELITIRKQLRVEPGEEFKVKIFMKNVGNMPWFSNKSKCPGPKMSLGSDKPRDAASLFYAVDFPGWEGDNRIGMDQYRTDPGEIASFTFTAKAPEKEDVYKQVLTPVLKGIKWVDEDQISFNTIVGDVITNAGNLRKKLLYSTESGSISHVDLEAEKVLVVDRVNQEMFLLLGEHIVRNFPVSTGAPATPTPLGENVITLKQEVRVGASPPHYIMPRFQWFRAGGYGFHALPSLAGNGDVYWTEALDHIGRAVSHGCVRLLPEDADFLFEFTDIGTRVIIAENVEEEDLAELL